jgi:peptidoglycan hydrolase CwlO-like protein
MNFLKHTYFGNTVHTETQTDPPIDYVNVVNILHTVYTTVHSVEQLRGKLETLETENEHLSKENTDLKTYSTILQKEIQELKDTIQTYKTRDYVSKYHLLRQGKAFPFSPILSKSAPTNHAEAPT